MSQPPPPGFMIHMYSAFFNVKSICGFTSTFVYICSATSYPFGFTPRSRRPPLDILKVLATKLSNQDKKFSFIQIYEDRALAISSGFTKMCHNTNIIVQNTGGDASSLNGKIKIPDKTLANITRAILLNSSHMKEI